MTSPGDGVGMSGSTKFALWLLAVHSAVVVFILAAVLVAGDSGGGLLWAYLFYPDLPVVLFLLKGTFHIAGFPAWNTAFGPALLFGIGGGAWWFLIGKVLGLLVGYLRRFGSEKGDTR